MKQFTLHPVIRIISLILLAIALQMAKWRGLELCFALLLFGLWQQQGGAEFIKLLRRARWLLLSILLIYAFATPGEYVPGMPVSIAPTYEGLRSGALQAMRLITMLAALAWLLAGCTREQLMSGIYTLLLPFKPLGANPERFAVRLWLTLYYVENAPPGLIRRLREQGWKLQQIIDEPSIGISPSPNQIMLMQEPLRWHNMALLLVWVPIFWMLR
ncbi:MAG TPA: CbiQ family ECF transporter T component [Methylophilaceae bacterium]|jgi:energy-coupling factor transport system permease protein